MQVYGDIVSGNCYKVKLLLTLLGIAHTWHHVDVLRGESHSPEFLRMNPLGKIPVVVWPDGRVLTESNAILHCLAEGTPYLPQEPWLRAQILEWQFFEQYSHEPSIAVARFIQKYLGLPAERLAEHQTKLQQGHAVLQVMESKLAHGRRGDFLVGGCYTIADIALYAYTHVADEGGFDLQAYPYICAWLNHLQAQAGHVTMQQLLQAQT